MPSSQFVLLFVARLVFFAVLSLSASHGFQQSSTSYAAMSRRMELSMSADRENSVFKSRRNFFSAAFLVSLAQPASAAIDVSGLRSEGGGGNPSLKEQLRAYDGSAAARANQLKEITTTQSSVQSNIAAVIPQVEEQGTIASWAYRAAPGFKPRLTRAGSLGTLFRYDDQVVAPNNKQSLSITFEFPSDWLQLDKFLGGITYVDQRNGDRLYVLRTKLPDGERLATIPKKFMGSSIFDPQGVIVKSQGVEVDEYKVMSSKILNDCPKDTCATRRRFQIKYFTVTGNGLRVERRALVDAYEVTPAGDVYMMMTSSNAVKFEAGGIERDTAEAIVDSFRINI